MCRRRSLCLIGLILTLGILGSQAQGDITLCGWSSAPMYRADTTIYTPSQVDSLPQWPGGNHALMTTLDSLVQYHPREWADIQLQREHYGYVVVHLVIEADGRMTHFEIYRSVEPRVDREALRLIGLLPSWQPAQKAGRAVRVDYYLPVCFPPITPLTANLSVERGPLLTNEKDI